MKWIPLSIFAAVFGGLGWLCMDLNWSIPAAVFGAVVVVLALTALAEFVDHYWDNASHIYERFMRAKSTTPVVAIAEAIRNQHPENARLLNRFTARAVWDVKLNLDKRERDVMLRGTNIHLGFVEFVLNNSVNGQLYPRWKFAEGAFEWDPYKQVTDRAQHEEFELWLNSQLIVTRHFEKSPAVFLPPWTPDLLKEAMGIVDQIEFYAPKAKVITKEMAAEKKPGSTAQAVMKDEREIPLSDEDMKQIKELEAAREQMSVREYMKSIGKEVQ